MSGLMWRHYALYSMALLLASSTAGVPAYAEQKSDPEALYQSSSTFHGKMVVLPIGTTFEGRLESTIGSSVSNPGQKFEIMMASPVLGNGTEVLIPSGAKVLGEVVEAIPSSRLPRQKGYPKPTGKLRVQLSGLRMPDGVTYPMVASITGESFARGGRNAMGKGRANENLGGGVAYVGSSASFEAVAPGMSDRLRARPGQAPKVVSRRELMRDPIFGEQGANNNNSNSSDMIRSLVKRNFNLWIFEGSPISIELEAPLKLGIAPARGSSSILEEATAPRSGGRRFTKDSEAESQKAQESINPTAPPEPPPLIPSAAAKGPSFLPQAPVQTAPVQAPPQQFPPPGAPQQYPPPGAPQQYQPPQQIQPQAPQQYAPAGTAPNAPAEQQQPGAIF